MANFLTDSFSSAERAASDTNIAQANEARKRDAYNALNKIYGPIAGNPEAALELQAYDTGQQTQPYKVESAKLGVEGQRLQNQSQEFNVEHQPDVFQSTQAQRAASTNALSASARATNQKTDMAGAAQELQMGLGALNTINDIYGKGGSPDDAVAAFDKLAPQLARFSGVTPEHISSIRSTVAQGKDATAQLYSSLRQAGIAGGMLTPEGMAVAAAQYGATGQLPAVGQGKNATAVRSAIINEVGQIAKVNGVSPQEVTANWQYYKQRGTYLNDLAKSGPGTAGGLVRSAGAVLAHMDVLSGYIDALSNHNLRAANAASQLYKEQTGKAAPTNFDAQKTIVTDELTRYLIARGGGVTDREEMKKQVSKASSPAQLRGVIDTWQSDMVGQLAAQRQQASAVKAEGQFDAQLTPRVRQLLNTHGGGQPGAKGGAGGTSQFKAGTEYTDANGNKATYNGGDPNDPASWQVK